MVRSIRTPRDTGIHSIEMLREALGRLEGRIAELKLMGILEMPKNITTILTVMAAEITAGSQNPFEVSEMRVNSLIKDSDERRMMELERLEQRYLGSACCANAWWGRCRRLRRTPESEAAHKALRKWEELRTRLEPRLTLPELRRAYSEATNLVLKAEAVAEEERELRHLEFATRPDRPVRKGRRLKPTEPAGLRA